MADLRILVTGGAGFIGSHLCDGLVEGGHELVVLDNFSSGKRENLLGVEGRAQIIEGDVVTDLGRVPEGRFDVVVHLAALISGYDSLNQPDAYVRANVEGMLRVIEFAREHAIPRIIFASSSTVYGASADVELDEDVLPRPLSVYAATKLMGENLLAMYGELYGFSHCSLRFFNVYGPRQATDHPYANVTCKFSAAAATGEPIDLYGDGQQTRDFVYVDDVVDSLLAVLSESPSTTYNIGTGREARIRDLINVLEHLSGRPFQIRQLAPWPNDIRRISADTSRAKRELGLCAKTSLADGLARTVDFFRHNSGAA